MRYRVLFFSLLIMNSGSINGMQALSINDIPDDVIQHEMVPHLIYSGTWLIVPHRIYSEKWLFVNCRTKYSKEFCKDEDITTIRSLAHSNRKFWKAINNEKVTRCVINRMAQVYEENKLSIAMQLRTRGAGVWIKQSYPAIEKDLAGYLMKAVAGRANEVTFIVSHCPLIIKYLENNPSEGESALYSAAGCWQNEIVDKLIKAGANVNHQGNSQETALHKAVASGNLKVIKLLINAGADYNVKATYHYPTPTSTLRLTPLALLNTRWGWDPKSYTGVMAARLLRSRMSLARLMWSYIANE